MRRIHALLLSALVFCGTAAADQGKGTSSPPQDRVESEKVVVSDDAISEEEAAKAAALHQLQLRNSMNAEIADRLETEKATIAELSQDLENASTGEARFGIQRQVQDARLGTWRDLLAIQLRYAILSGHQELAQQLQERVVRLDEGLSKTQQPTTTRSARKGGK